MKSNQNNQFKKRFSAKLVIFLLLATMIVSGYFALTALGQEDGGLLAGKYKSSLNKVEALLKNFPGDVFGNPLLKKLDQPIKVPFETGAVGNPNLFKIPEPPEILLNAGIINR
ncbi:MAG: hypothetical protein WCV73_01325 [Patescibacteria group bacterium]|jgi:hypothetical protein